MVKMNDYIFILYFEASFDAVTYVKMNAREDYV